MATIFTRIIRGEIPSFKILEDESHFAFLDINPVSEGHTLVVPKKETDYIFDLTDHQIGDLILFSKKVARGIDRSLMPLRTGVIVQGLEVPHAHIHLIPLYSHAQPLSLSHHVKLSDERMKELATTIASVF